MRLNNVHLILFLLSFICGVLVSSNDTCWAKDILANLQHKYVQVSGSNFHYVTKGAGQPLILLPGFPETWYSWRKNIDSLALYFMEQIVSSLELRFVLECGYFLQAERPKEVNNLILKYLPGDSLPNS